MFSVTKRDSLLARPKFAIPLIAIFLSLAACTSGGQSSSAILSPISASDPSRIDLTVHDSLPVADARLVDPRGAVTPAVRIDRDRINYRSNGAEPGMGVGVAGGSGGGISTGVGLGVTIPLFSGGDSDNSFTESRASFRIPDVAAYDKTWQQWKIEVDLSDGSSRRSMELAAPAPAKIVPAE